MLDRSLMEKKEIKLDFEAQIRELRDTLKKCKEKLSREILQKEEAERNCHHLKYQLEEANRRFAVLESQKGDAAYLLLKNDCGEEDSIISKLSSFRYVETKEGISKGPLQGLYFEEVNSASTNHIQSTTLVMSSSKSSKQTLENGPLLGRGQIVRVYEKHDRFGLGYRPTSRHPVARDGKRFNPIIFSSAGYQWDYSVAVVDGASSNQRAVFGLIHKCPPGFKLHNWTSIVVLMVFLK